VDGQRNGGKPASTSTSAPPASSEGRDSQAPGSTRGLCRRTRHWSRDRPPSPSPAISPGARCRRHRRSAARGRRCRAIAVRPSRDLRDRRMSAACRSGRDSRGSRRSPGQLQSGGRDRIARPQSRGCGLKIHDPPSILVHDEDRLIEGVHQEALARESLVLIGRSNAFPVGAQVKIRDLLDIDLVIPGKRNQLRHQIEALFRRKGCKVKIGVEIDSMRLANDLVRQGEYFAIVPASGVEVSSSDKVTSWLIVGASITWALCVQKRHEQSPAIREVVARLKPYVLQSPRLRIAG
jgi:hypothetical protein